MKRILLLLACVVTGVIVVRFIGGAAIQPQPLTGGAVPAGISPAQPAAIATENESVAPSPLPASMAADVLLRYCERRVHVAGWAKKSAIEFVRRHPNFGISLADAELILDSIHEIGIAAAQPILDIDNEQKVLAGSAYQGKHVSELEVPANNGDPEAALIFGSYLLFQGYAEMVQKQKPLNRSQLEQGERYLQNAYRAGKVEAVERLYTHFFFASRRTWRNFGASEDWEYTYSKRNAYAEWILSYGPAGRALIVDGDDRSLRVNSPAGVASPGREDQDPILLATKLIELEQEMPPPLQSAELKYRREQLLWLNRRGTTEAVFASYLKDCKNER